MRAEEPGVSGRCCARLALGLVVLVLGLAVLSPGPSRADILYPNPTFPPVLVTIGPDVLTTGSNVTVDVATFQEGMAADADTVPTAYAEINAVDHPFMLYRTAVGLYRGVFRLPSYNPSPTSRMYDGLVVVDASLRGIAASSRAQFRWFGPGLAIRVTAATSRVAPDQWFQMTAQVLRDGVLVDPDTIQVRVVQGANVLGGNATPSRVGLGTYVARLAFSGSSVFYLQPFAVFTAELGGVAFSGGMPIQVPRYQVWLHGLPSARGVVRGELWVANGTGVPAPGVSLSFTNLTGETVSGVTDSRGAFPIYLDGSASSGWVTTLNVAAGTPMADRSMLGDFPRQAPTVVPQDPAILPDGSPRDFMRPGQGVTRSYRLLNDTLSLAPYADTAVSYYVYSLHEIVASGVGRTDSTGVVQLTFRAPSAAVQVVFFAGSRLIGSTPYFVGSPMVSLTSTPLELGGLTSVDVLLPAELQDRLDTDASVTWDVRLPDLSAGDKWTRLTQFLDDDFVRTERGTSHAFGLPSFLPAAGSFILAGYVGIDFQNLAQFAVIHVGEAASVPFNTTYPVPPAESPAVLVLLVAGGAIAVAMVAVWLVGRRRGRGP